MDSATCYENGRKEVQHSIPSIIRFPVGWQDSNRQATMTSVESILLIVMVAARSSIFTQSLIGFLIAKHELIHNGS